VGLPLVIITGAGEPHFYEKVKKHGMAIRVCEESRFLLNRAVRLYETVYNDFAA
jgi:hypothetical protein